MENLKKKMVNTLIASISETEAQISIQPESAANLLNYIRNVELASASSLVGIACEDTIPEQPDDANVIYIAAIKPGANVTFQNFKNPDGQPVTITSGENETVYALLLWNKQHWSYQSASASFVLGSNLVYPSVRQGDELLPRVAPNVSLYGFFNYQEIEGFHAHQAIAYDSVNNQLLFAVADSYNSSNSYAYIYITDMKLKQKSCIKVPGAYRIQDIIIGHNGKLYVVPQDPNLDKKSIIRVYTYPNISFPPIELKFGPELNNKYIESLCYSSELNNYIVKVENRIIFYDTSFRTMIRDVNIDTDDIHGDPIASQTIEYYNGHILVLNSGNWNVMESTKNAYLNVYRMDGSKVETYRYPDSAINMEAQGICKIGNGKYLFTHYGGPKIEVRLLDFNTPSHTHTLSDIIDFSKIGTASNALYVNPLLEGKSYLSPDGSLEKPFPNVPEAVAYAKLFHSQATIQLMDGDYGTVDLNNIHMNLTFKGMNKNTCLIDKINICKCSGLTFENITFCHSEKPFEATSSTIEINNCSFPNGKPYGSDTTETYGISISKSSAVTLKDCEIYHFGTAVNVKGSKLFCEGSQALKGTGNHCGIRGEGSIIRGTKDLTGNVCAAQALLLNDCQCDGDFAAIKQTNGAIRPTDPQQGQFYFDLDANKPLWWNGSVWVDTTGKAY